MWRTFRKKPLRVRVIEELFQVRANITGLGVLSTAYQASVLYLVAAFCWLVPLALIWPPGSLTVQSEVYVTASPGYVPVINPLQYPPGDSVTVGKLFRVSASTWGYGIDSPATYHSTVYIEYTILP